MSKKGNGKDTSQNKIKFIYQKTNNYRAYHVDGAYGGINPNGNIYMAIFNERRPIPQIEQYDVKSGKAVLKSSEGKEGIIREVEAGLIFNYSTMVLLRDWMNNKINQFEGQFITKQTQGKKDK